MRTKLPRYQNETKTLPIKKKKEKKKETTDEYPSWTQKQESIINHNQVAFIPGMQSWLYIWKINVIHHINRQNKKSHMIILPDLNKAFNEIQNSLMIKL